MLKLNSSPPPPKKNTIYLDSLMTFYDDLNPSIAKSKIGGHLERHPKFIKRSRMDSWGLLVCCRGNFLLVMNMFRYEPNTLSLYIRFSAWIFRSDTLCPILVQVTIYCRPRIGQDEHLDTYSRTTYAISQASDWLRWMEIQSLTRQDYVKNY